MAADAGVDDVELIAANALHRRMTAAELKHIVGERVFRSFYPQGKLYNFDAEDRDNLAAPRHHRARARTSRSASGPPSPTCSSTSTSTSSRWTAATSRSAIGLASYKSLRHHHNAKTMVHSRSFMDHKHSADAPLRVADGPGHQGHREGLPDRDDAEQRRLPVAATTSCRSASGSGRSRTRPRCSALRRGLSVAPPKLQAQDVPRHAVGLRADRRQRRRGRGGARRRRWRRCTASSWSRCNGPVRRARDGRARTSAPTT